MSAILPTAPAALCFRVAASPASPSFRSVALSPRAHPRGSPPGSPRPRGSPSTSSPQTKSGSPFSGTTSRAPPDTGAASQPAFERLLQPFTHLASARISPDLPRSSLAFETTASTLPAAIPSAPFRVLIGPFREARAVGALPTRANPRAAPAAGALLADGVKFETDASVGPSDVKAAAIAACLASYISRQRGRH